MPQSVKLLFLWVLCLRDVLSFTGASLNIKNIKFMGKLFENDFCQFVLDICQKMKGKIFL